jgi:hypothetical protein
MARWNYNLREEGTKLRELIKEEKEAEIIEQIGICCKSLLNQLSFRDKQYFKYRIEELIDLLTEEANTIKNDLDECGLINGRLAEFYDICDDCKCWIEF